MIRGIGTDIASITRIEDTLAKYGERFINRILTPAEIVAYEASRQPVAWFAKRFAAKEAAAKALGTGISEGIGWQDFEIFSDDAGAPGLVLSGMARVRADAMGVSRIHLTLSDEREYAVAFVVLEG